MKKENLPKQFIIIFITAILIFISAKYTVDSVIKLSEIFNIGKEVIAISAVALGTSLPELFVGISAVKRKKGGMVFGNILGSNIMNSFAIMGIPSLFGAIIIPRSLILFSIPVMVGATLLFVFMTQERHTTKWEGMILMLGYILYIAKIFNLF